MTSEHETAEALEGTGGELPPLHYGALRRWLEAHPDLVKQAFEVKSFPRETRVFPSAALSAGQAPRALIVLSGELALTQVAPGGLAPHCALYRGDVWVNPNVLGPRRRGPRAAIRIEAIAASQVLLLTEQALRALSEQEAKELEGILYDYAELHRARRAFFQAVRGTVQFQNVCARHLHALLDAADVRSYVKSEEGEAIVIPQGSTDEEHQGVFLVLEGRLGEWRDPEDGQGPSVLIRALHPGSIFGDARVHSDEPAPCTVKVHSPTARVAVLHERHSERLMLKSPLFAGSVSESPADVWQRIAGDGDESAHAPEVVLFRSDELDAPMEMLIQAVAEATHQSYGDHILRVELVFSAQPAPVEPPPEWRSGEVPVYRLRAQDGQAAAGALQELARTLRGQWDYLFVQADPRLWKGLLPPAGSAVGFRPLVEGEVTWKLVYLSRDPLDAEPPPGFDRGSILYTALIEQDSERRPGPAFPAGTVRLPLELGPLARRRSFSQCSAAEQEIFRRWGRAITERVVAIALGAGGSWGFAEIALIRGMLERKIPIDVVSGASFGAVAGAFYSALGLEGLELLLKEAHKFLGIIAASVINSSAISFGFDRMLGHRRLEKVPLPFFPVGTNVSESQAFVLQRGTLGAGIRSSGIMPGLLSPDFTEDNSRVVDGAFINSVPASVLVSQRSNLIVATNVLSEPPNEKDPGPLLPGPVGWFLHGLNPVGRLTDLVRSTLILFHTGGDQAASGADVVYESPFISLPPWTFARGQEIVDEATRSLGPTLDQIEARWRLMARRRGELLSKVQAAREGLRRAAAGSRRRARVPA
ncbi:MAG: phospholipase [Myxococcaceae bacterium]|nr:phospholipase [Myxococcaceae bacterium]